MKNHTLDRIDGENYIYRRFTFDPKIQQHSFIGNEFLGMDVKKETRDFSAFERVVEAGPDGFLPNLVEELKNIFGDGNYIYDGYEIGEEDFGLYFYIKDECYESLLKKVKHWSEYHGFRDLIFWDE